MFLAYLLFPWLFLTVMCLPCSPSVLCLLLINCFLGCSLLLRVCLAPLLCYIYCLPCVFVVSYCLRVCLAYELQRKEGAEYDRVFLGHGDGVMMGNSVSVLRARL